MTVATRLGLVGGLAAVALALSRVLALVESTPEQPSILGTLLIATLIGAGIAAATQLARLGWPAQTIAVVLGALLVFARLAAPASLAGGLVPTTATLPAAGAELTIALELIRFGAAPVVASPGLIGVLAIVFLVLGAFLVNGIASVRPLLAAGPSLGFYLLCATLDRRPPTWWTPTALVVVGAIAFLAAALRSRGGRTRLRSTGRPLATHNWVASVVVVGLVAAAGTVSVARWASAVPESGLVAWRNPTGFGGGLFAGFSYNLFTSMQQDLSAESPEILFVARVSESAPPPDQLYWKLSTLDTFDGTYWLQAPLAVERPTSPSDWEAPDFSFLGDTVAVDAFVRIEALRMNILPVLYAPRGLSTEDRLLEQSYRSREDGSVKFDARSQQGLLYRITSQIPIPNLSILASEDGELSPMFENAQEQGFFNLPASDAAQPAPSSRLQTIYTALPEDFSDVIRGLSRQITEQATTDFEQGLVLEEFFRTTGSFVYNASVSTGHSALDLEDWLLDPESRNYREGYCEQFASAMALMARALGIPARVVIGFSPGTIQIQPDGAEVIVVRARNAHAWVELFMAGQGWIRFDPTPRADGSNPATVATLAFDPIAFLPEPADPSGNIVPGSIAAIDRRFLEGGLDPTTGGSPVVPTEPTRPWTAIAVVLMLIAIVPALKAVRRGWRLRRLAAGDVLAGWSELSDRLRDLGLSMSPSLTPTEVAAAVDQGIGPLAKRVTAAVYGNREFTDGRSALRLAESSLRARFSKARRLLSWFRPETLLSGSMHFIHRQPRVPRSRRIRPVAEN